MQTKVLAHSHGMKKERGKMGANATKMVTKTKCLGEKKKRGKKMETKLTVTSAYAVTEQKLSLLGFCLEM